MARFADEATLRAIAGRGGHGKTSFRREKYVERGGPDGGNGGDGGDVVVEATHNANTLDRYRHEKNVEAEDGEDGGPKNMTGARGEDRVIQVPVGTVVFDDDTGEQLADLEESGDRTVVAEGGEGGLGNTTFKASTNRAPTKSTPGEPGQKRTIRLELKLVADIGLVGFPSVGKSTIISAVSAAQPRTGAYHFTTTTPNLGVVQWKDFESFVVADIPGLIEGAHRGEGLGIQFLRHVERTNLLVHVIEVTPTLEDQDDGRDPIEDFETICEELRRHDEALADRPQLVVLNKIDLPFVRERVEELREHFQDERGLPFLAISAATGENIDEFKDYLGHAVSADEFSIEPEDWERE